MTSTELQPVQNSNEVTQLDFVNDNELVIRYRPYASMQKWIQYRFSTWNSYKAWFATALVVIFFGFDGPGKILAALEGLAPAAGKAGITALAQGGTGTLALDWLLPFVMTLLGVGGTAVAAKSLANPTHVSVNPAGVCLEWHRFGYANGVMLQWKNIERIELYYPPGKTSPQDSIIRFKDANGLRGNRAIDHYPIQLRLGAIATIEDRSNLLKAFELWSGDIPRDPLLMEVLTPAQDSSYTELWLQALSAPPKRERLTPLIEGATLQEGKYVLLGQLGVGGQGTAYLARRSTDNQEVVLKEFILPVYVDVNIRRQALESMQHEAAMLRRLDNQRIVRLMEFFVEDHRGYLVLEKIDGYSLRRIVEETGKMDEQKVRSLADQMCMMLTYLHSLTPPVVHRDFTPDNLILGKDGILKLVDFNVAQQTESTATGTVVGKHSYLPPEQFRGRPVPQSDIYAMGATLYYLLLGHDPQPITCLHPIKERPEISAELDQIVAKATALDTAKRYEKIELLTSDLNPNAVLTT